MYVVRIGQSSSNLDTSGLFPHETCYIDSGTHRRLNTLRFVHTAFIEEVGEHLHNQINYCGAHD